jgi:hypothetical protein
VRSSSGARFAVALGVAVAAASSHGVRPRLLQALSVTKERITVAALPDPQQTVVASLGHRAALADLMFANTLVQAGIAIQEKRAFPAADYLDTINALDPSFRAPYRYADTLITVQAVAPAQDDYRRARAVLRRGLENFAYDQELWSSAGQFLAYLAPRWLEDPAEQKDFRAEGARVLARACELVGTNENVPYHCVTAARLLSEAGEGAAAERFVERLLGVSDDEAVQKLAIGYLARVQGEGARARAERRARQFNQAWGRDLKFLSKDQLLIVGPATPAPICAGLDAPPDGCASSWRAWGEALPGD